MVIYRRGPEDSKRININQSHEVEYWSSKFDVSPLELRIAVDQVGDSVDNIEEYLSKSKEK